MPYGLCGSLVSILPACKCQISSSVWTSAQPCTSPSAATCLPALTSPVVSLQTPHGHSPPLPLKISFAFSKSHTPLPLQHCGLGNRSNEASSHPVLTSSPSQLLNPNSLPSCSEERVATIFQILGFCLLASTRTAHLQSALSACTPANNLCGEQTHIKNLPYDKSSLVPNPTATLMSSPFHSGKGLFMSVCAPPISTTGHTALLHPEHQGWQTSITCPLTLCDFSRF